MVKHLREWWPVWVVTGWGATLLAVAEVAF
jgi:hypothetical protein